MSDLEGNDLDDAAGNQRENSEGNEIDDDVNRVAGGRAVAVAEFVATSFVDTPDAIEIEVRERGSDIMLSLHADRGDVGRLIGRRGRVINALRQVVRAAGSVDGERVSIDIAE